MKRSKCCYIPNFVLLKLYWFCCCCFHSNLCRLSTFQCKKKKYQNGMLYRSLSLMVWWAKSKVIRGQLCPIQHLVYLSWSLVIFYLCNRMHIFLSVVEVCGGLLCMICCSPHSYQQTSVLLCYGNLPKYTLCREHTEKGSASLD